MVKIGQLLPLNMSNSRMSCHGHDQPVSLGSEIGEFQRVRMYRVAQK